MPNAFIVKAFYTLKFSSSVKLRTNSSLFFSPYVDRMPFSTPPSSLTQKRASAYFFSKTFFSPLLVPLPSF